MFPVSLHVVEEEDAEVSAEEELEDLVVLHHTMAILPCMDTVEEGKLKQSMCLEAKRIFSRGRGGFYAPY